MAFKKATKEKIKLRMAIIGPPGSGKTYSALAVATKLGKRIAVIDSEGKKNIHDPNMEVSSAAKYCHRFDFDYDVLKTYHPNNYIEKIREAEAEGYDVIVIDSLSHAWAANEGALDLVSKEQMRNKNLNNYTAWRNVTPLMNNLIDTIISSTAHVIVTIRAKEGTAMETTEKGSVRVKKVGLQPIMRDGIEYEFDVVLDLDKDHQAVVSKTRLDTLDGMVIDRPGDKLAKTLLDWLDSGVEPQRIAPVQEDASVGTKVTPASQVQNAASTQPANESSASSEEDNAEVVTMIKTALAFVKKNALGESPDEVIELAKGMIAHEFDVEDLKTIPSSKLDALGIFMRGPMLKALRKDGLVKVASKKAAE